MDLNYDSDKNVITIPVGSLGTPPPVYNPSKKELDELIKRRHPEYDKLKAHWEFLQETYEGGREWFDTNIFKYVKEGEEEFEDRKERAYRFNHTREVVDLVNKYLFKKAIVRKDDVPEFMTQFWKKTTTSGLSITEFMRQVAKQTSIYGRIGIVIDKPATGDKPVSRADAKKLKLQPYAYVVPPTALLDYSFDRNGDLNWILVEEIFRDDEVAIGSSGIVGLQYRLWDRKDWSLYEERTNKDTKKKEVVLVDKGTHGLGMVPVILVDNTINDDNYETQSMIDDIAYLDRAVANYLSNLDAIIQDQTFSQLAMPAQNLLPGEDSYNKLTEMGTKRIFLYDGENGSAPEYLSPDVKQADLILAAIHKIINEIYHTVGLAGERTKQDNALGIDNSSGVAKAFDFERVNALLASKADALEKAEDDICKVVSLWSGTADQVEDAVSYPDNFDIRDLYDEFDIAARLALIEAPDTLRREQMNVVVGKLFPQMDDKLLKDIESELKEWPADPMEVLQQITDIGASGKPPAVKSSASPGAKKKQGQNNKPAEK